MGLTKKPMQVLYPKNNQSKEENDRYGENQVLRKAGIDLKQVSKPILRVDFSLTAKFCRPMLFDVEHITPTEVNATINDTQVHKKCTVYM